MPARSSRASAGAPSFDANATQGESKHARSAGMAGDSELLFMMQILRSKTCAQSKHRLKKTAPDHKHGNRHPARIASGGDGAISPAPQTEPTIEGFCVVSKNISSRTSKSRPPRHRRSIPHCSTARKEVGRSGIDPKETSALQTTTAAMKPRADIARTVISITDAADRPRPRTARLGR